MRVVLHIGATKTGSSALQKFLALNRDRLLESGVYYPEIGTVSNAHHLVSAALHPGAFRLHTDALSENAAARRAEFSDMVQKILETAQANDAEVVILSSEYLWGAFNDAFYKAWGQALGGVPMSLYAVLRRPDYWIQSSYLQALKGGMATPFDAWYEKFRKMPAKGADFHAVLSRWRTYAPELTADIRSYEQLLKNENLFGDALAITGADLDTDELSHPQSTVNPSPGPKSAEILLKLNQCNLDDSMKERLRKLVLSAMQKREVGAPVSFLDNERRRAILESYVATNDALIRDFCPEDEELLFAEPWP